MDVDEIRRINIRALEAESGSPTAAAARVGMSYAQYLNTRDGAREAKTGKRRGMRKETAWRFEDAYQKPRGWLDHDHSAVSSTPLRALSVPMFALKCLECQKVFHESFIQLEANKTINCPSCGNTIIVDDYYGEAVLETILHGFSSAGFTLGKR